MAKLCPQCQKDNPSSANVCMYCGTRLVENSEMDKIDALHSELSEAKDTIKVLKEALKEKGQKNEAVEQKPPILPPPVPVSERSKKTVEKNKPFPYAVLWLGIVLLLIAAGLIAYFGFYKPYITDLKAPRFYTFASSVVLRSTPDPGVEYNKLTSLPYGSELIVYENGRDWSKVKWNDNQTGKSIKGYISSPYILPSEDFKILNGIWGDNESKEIIYTTKCRLALLYYFKKNNLIGWKVYSKQKGSKFNTTYYGRVVNPGSKFTDFGVILKKDSLDRRICLLFSFDDDETPRLVYEEQAPPTGDISLISYGYNPYTDAYEYHINYR